MLGHTKMLWQWTEGPMKLSIQYMREAKESDAAEQALKHNLKRCCSSDAAYYAFKNSLQRRSP